ncbi:CHASE domain-containing protein [Roseateles albus]|uniref:histidine kinase n=1 Tax=Roseateles albus TaxID=2987525 RepID=A0ABT5KFK0_9BURK|nr:CHASE domain-containing protein [Roseateles albus]MDC8772229.1 CHASE domain-containing protein [Roseateles albus]
MALWQRFLARSGGKGQTWLVLLLGLGLSAAGGLWQQRAIRADAEAEFLRNVERTVSELERRFAQPVYGLKGLRAAYASSQALRQQLTRAEFRAHVSSRDLATEFPGVRGFGYVEHVFRSELERFVAAERADGVADFAIRQMADKHHPDLFVIKRIEPAANNSGALGLDIGSEALRRAGAELAAGTGLPTITGAIVLVQDQKQTAGVLLFVPVYRRGVPLDNAEQRTAALLGLLSAPIVLNELLGDMPDVKSGRIDFELYDARPGTPLGAPIFDGDGHVAALGPGQVDSVGRRFSHQRSLKLVNREMTLRMNSTPQFDAGLDRSTPWLLFAAGALATGLLAAMLRQLGHGRELAEAKAAAKTVELEAAQRDNQALLSTLNLAAIVSVADRAGRITMANEAFCQISGYTQQELLGQTHQIVNSGLQPAQTWSEIWQTISVGFAWRGEVCNRAKDGSLYWVDTFIAPVLGADEQIEKYIAIRTDITANKKAEEALRWNESLLEMMSNSSPLAFFVVDNRSDKILYFNQRFCELWGMAHLAEPIRRGELKNIDTMPTRRALVVDEAGFTSKYLSLQDEGNQAQFEDEIAFKDGRTIRRFSTQIRGDDGRYFGRFFIFEDVTERKQALLALQDARAAAEAASTAKSQFLANMSHEIRTPMNAILGMLTLLRKTEMTPRQADYAAKSDGAARQLLGLLNEILDFSKIEAGKMELDPQPFGLDQLLRDLAVILAANVGAKPVEVLFDIDPALPQRLIGDAMRLQQVLINLGGNAIKFTPSGEVLLRVQLLQRSGAEVTLQFSVRDSGIGIAAENQTRIFSGFTQAESSTTRRFGGTGLGVAISQRFVALMGGELTLESELGRGSRFAFTISLPLAPDQQQGDASAQGAAWRTLIVEDNTHARVLLASMGQALGWQVEQAASGDQALSLMQAAARAGMPYQLVFVDGQMPGLDGWQTCQRIAHLGLKGDALVLLMVTAQGRDLYAQQVQTEQDSVDGFVLKPLTASMLFDAALAAREARSQAQPKRRAGTAPGEQRLAKLRLLLVEDNPNNQQVASELLTDEGAVVEIANHGREAVELLVATPEAFDVVLMDLQMPVMDGLSAARFIRQELGLSRLPIVAMTANAMSSDREACLAAGMNDHIGKPFNLDELVRVLRRLGGLEQGLAEAMPASPAVLVEAAAAEIDPAQSAASEAGVDLELALRRLGGKRASYIRLLGSFVRDLAALPEQLRSQVEQGDFESATRLLHTLKGTAATLGATGMAGEAGEAEARLGAWRQQPPADAAEPAQVCEASCALMTTARPVLLRLHEVLLAQQG